MRIAAWIGAGVVAVLLAAVFLAPVLIDWDGFKPRIAEAVRDATGKELRIDGPLAVSLFPAIEVSATGIHLRDSVSNTEVVAIGRVAAKVRLWPLLTKRLVIDSFVISEPELNLLIDADGRPNWAIAPAAAPEPAEVAPSQDREPPLRDVFLADLRIEGGRVSYADARSGQTLVAEDITLAASLPEPGRRVSLAGQLRLNDEPTKVSLSGDAPGGVLNGERLGIAASVESRLLSARYEGNVTRRPTMGADGGIEVDIASLAELLAWLGQPLPAAQPDPGAIMLRASFTAEGETFELQDAVLRSDGFEARAKGSFIGGAVPRVRVDLDSDPLDLDLYLPVSQDEAPPAEPEEMAQIEDALAGLSQAPFDLSGLRALDATVRVRLGGVKARGFEAGPIDLKLDLEGGVATAEITEIGLYEGVLSGTVKLDASGDALGVKTDLRFDRISLGALAIAATGEAPLSATASGRVAATGRGDSPRDLVESLAGEVSLGLRDVVLANAPIEPITAVDLTVVLPGLSGAPRIEGRVVYNNETTDLAVRLAPIDQIMAGDDFAVEVSLDSRLLTLRYAGNIRQPPTPGRRRHAGSETGLGARTGRLAGPTVARIPARPGAAVVKASVLRRRQHAASSA